MNCFRSLYLWVDLQPFEATGDIQVGCELLSFFVPLGWFTAGRLVWLWSRLLWIAFVLCTFGLIYSFRTELEYVKVVVNCFRSLYLWVDLQPLVAVKWWGNVVNCFRSLYLWVDLQLICVLLPLVSSCELLSFFVPLGWFTARRSISTERSTLWIAFVLCTFGLIYSLLTWTVVVSWLWIAFVLCTFGLIYSRRNL